MHPSDDSYLTIAAPTTGEFKDRGSKFMAWAFPVHNEDEIDLHLQDLRKAHPKARHHCFAWRLGSTGDLFRAYDDGEPSGTAGRPILGQIDSFQLTNTLVVVVRYFGGTLLGTSGLINAYRSAARAALEKAQTIRVYEEVKIKIDFDYSIMGELMNAVKQVDAKILEQYFDDDPSMIISIRKAKVEEELSKVKAILLRTSVEEVQQIIQIPGIEFHVVQD